MEIIASLFMLLGSLTFLISAVGLIRMPDIYNRIQAGTKATSVGTIFMLIGLSILHPIWIPKLVIILVFILLTNPISSHVVARAAYFNKEKLCDKTVVDQLEQTNKEIV